MKILSIKRINETNVYVMDSIPSSENYELWQNADAVVMHDGNTYEVYVTKAYAYEHSIKTHDKHPSDKYGAKKAHKYFLCSPAAYFYHTPIVDVLVTTEQLLHTMRKYICFKKEAFDKLMAEYKASVAG